MSTPPNTLNLPDGIYWDVYDAHTAEKVLRNATRDDVSDLVSRRTKPVTLEPVGAFSRSERLEGRADKKREGA